MSLDPLQRLTFAARTTIAALAAALIAFAVHLPQASTSMITVFIVSQPLAGMVLSKSLFRAAGTMIGAVVAVALTVAFSQVPEFYAVAISLWIGLCVTTSVYLRDAPVAYAALLSGYTAAIIAFPAVAAPDTIFQAALDRTSEIVVGIAVAATLSQLFFPQSAARALARATDEAIASASRWAADTLRGRPDGNQVARDRRALVGAVSRIEALRVHARFEIAAVRLSNQRLRLLHSRLVGFLALLVSLHDRLEILRRDRPRRAKELKPLLDRAAAAMGPDASPESRIAAKAAIEAALPDFSAMRRDRAKLFERTVLLRLADLIEMRGGLSAFADARTAPDGGETTAALSRYRDHALALVSGVVAFAAMLTFCVFWIASGWNAGAGAAIMVAVMTSLFAQQDDPARSAGAFLAATALGSVVAGIYAFGVLPGLEGFETLALALSPALFALAYVMTIPALALPALAAALGALNLIGLTNVTTPDFSSFANAALAQLAGIGLAVIALNVLRPIGAAWPIARLTAGVASDLADAIGGRRERGRLAFESQMFDRIDGLMARLDLSDPDQLAIEQGSLAGLRVGLNALALRRVVRRLPAEASAPLADALAELVRHFRRLSRGELSSPPAEKLDAALEAALGADLGDMPETADVPVWIEAIRASMAQHPRVFGALPAAAPAQEPMRIAA